MPYQFPICLKTHGGSALTYGGNLLYLRLPPVGPRVIRYKFNDPVHMTQPALEGEGLQYWEAVRPEYGIWDLYVDRLFEGTSYSIYDWSKVFLGELSGGYGVQGQMQRFASSVHCTNMSYNIIDMNSDRVTRMCDPQGGDGLFGMCTQLIRMEATIPFKGTSCDTMFRHDMNLEYVAPIDTSARKPTDMQSMFYECYKLKQPPVLDTSAVANFRNAFDCCYALESLPAYDFSQATNTVRAFADCWKINGGALALYTQLSTKEITVTNHAGTFNDCGRDTVIGAAELAQIPSDWK